MGMREIKFRGYSDGYNAWKYGFGVSIVELSESMQKELGVREIVYLHTDEGKVSVVAESVGQYTGLKCVNGVEIYEGDILYTLDNNEEYEEYVGVVEYDSVGRFVTTGFPHVTSCDCFVKGNIYKNQELLVGDSNE